MIKDSDIWRSAKLMIERLGRDALIRAQERALELGALGDAEGSAAWLRIAEAIEQLECTGPDTFH